MCNLPDLYTYICSFQAISNYIKQVKLIEYFVVDAELSNKNSL